MLQTDQPQSSLSQSAPKNWLVESILVTIFCCLPFGIAGIVFASQVNNKYALGDYKGALEASNNAARWTKIGCWIGVAGIVASLAFTFLFGGMAFWQSRYNNY